VVQICDGARIIGRVSNVDTRHPGRPRQFDEDAVLDQLTDLFWRNGYANTSVADMVAATGVHKPSLYRAFGSKEALFACILHRYLEAKLAMFEVIIDEVGPGVDGIHEFLNRLKSDLSSGDIPKGCLIVSSSTELFGTTDGFERFGAVHREGLRDRIRVLIARAEPGIGAPTGGQAEAATDHRTDLFITFMLGLDVRLRGGADDSELGRAVDAMHATVETWRVRS